jgi:hypothetical protein
MKGRTPTKPQRDARYLGSGGRTELPRSMLN